jgi:hypothetical protein
MLKNDLSLGKMFIFNLVVYFRKGLYRQTFILFECFRVLHPLINLNLPFIVQDLFNFRYLVCKVIKHFVIIFTKSISLDWC